MVIYVEFAIIDNLVINSLLLLLTNKILRLNAKYIFIFFSALIGTIFSLISPILPNYFSYIIKPILAILMPLIILKNINFKKLITSIVVFILLTALFIGFCIFICFSFNIAFVQSKNGYFVYNFPIGLALFLCGLIYYIIKNLVKIFYQKKHVNNFTYIIRLFNNNIVYETNAFLDSGNFLIDNDSQKPINIINYNVFYNLFPNINLTNILFKKIDKIPIKNAKYINVSSIGQKQEILVFEISKIQLISQNNTRETDIMSFNNILLGLSLKNFKSTLNAECILNYELLK